MRYWLYPLWLLALAGLISLGLWQLDRAEQKRLWQTEQAGEALQFSSGPGIEAAMAGRNWLKAELKVAWPDVNPLYLDNRTQQGKAGYELLLPVQLEDGSFMVANLGWLPLPASREVQPIVGRPEAKKLSGVLGYPVDTYTLGAEQGDKPWRLQQQSLALMESRWRLDLHPWVIWLEQPLIPGIEARAPGAGQMPPERHVGYAVQWFALALALLILGGVLEWKTRKKQHHG
ncbi:SURF1 family protein [Marinobacterium sp. YM272]|uniref:SURF1 family protein n=1 Tax=Marinobacterium sp. YM272 TaxID=3421654 RepID=UPI003D7F819A